MYFLIFVFLDGPVGRETEVDLSSVKKKVSGSRWVSSASASDVGEPICQASTLDSRLSTDGFTKQSAVLKPCPDKNENERKQENKTKTQKKELDDRY
jgi:hypothetical protein